MRATRLENIGTRVLSTTLRDRLPAIAIPLRQTDHDVALDLQALIDRCYEEARYDDDIDYLQEPDPPLDTDHARWADDLLRQTQSTVAKVSPGADELQSGGDPMTRDRRITAWLSVLGILGIVVGPRARGRWCWCPVLRIENPPGARRELFWLSRSGRGKRKAGLRVDSLESLRRGGDTGPAIVVGDPDASLSILAVRHATPRWPRCPRNQSSSLGN